MPDKYSIITNYPNASNLMTGTPKTEGGEYDDGNIPEIDLPKDSWITEPLPESTRPRKDGPGGDGDDQ